MIILGLDISTSNVGMCITDSDASQASRILYASALPISSVQGLDAKSQAVKLTFESIKQKYNIDVVVIEEALVSYTKRKSTGHTISLLLRFNGIVSYIAKSVFNVPIFLKSFSEARASLGLKPPKSVDIKEFILRWTKSRPEFDNFIWPTKIMKSGKQKNQERDQDFCYDIADAFVMAKWAALFLKKCDLNDTII